MFDMFIQTKKKRKENVQFLKKIMTTTHAKYIVHVPRKKTFMQLELCRSTQ
jgi:hypothetical protein